MDLTQDFSTPVTLAQALRLPPGACLALTGAGGKTTALFRLARQLSGSVLVSATTHLAIGQLALADHHFVIHSPGDLPAPAQSLPEGVLLFTGPLMAGERVSGLDALSLQRLWELAERQKLSLLLEADGSRRLPMKAPAVHEPAVPSFANYVVATAGLTGLGQPLDEITVHRPDVFAELSGLKRGNIINPEALARVMASPQGGLKNIPAGARRVALLNQASTPQRVQQARQAAALLLPAFDAVVTANLGATREVLAVDEPVAGIVLAAGRASRYGQPKQLLLWQGEPLVRRAARTALEAGLSPVVVVTGAHAVEVQAAVQDLPVLIAVNSAWAEGQSTSLKTGLQALPAAVGAAIFLLADQPGVSAALLRGLVNLHAETFLPLAAPRVGERRANPGLFDRSTFGVLQQLSGDVGGRALFTGGAYPTAWLPWDDADLLMDVDTPDDYRSMLERGE